MIKYRRRQKRFANLMQHYLAEQTPEQRLHLDGPGTNSLAAWFLGPCAENKDLFAELIGQAVDANAKDRATLYDDPPYITSERTGPDYDESVCRMKEEYEKLLDQLRGCVPFFSYRYQAHMNWDLTMPSMLGYFAAMLYNQNNVALEASPVTSHLEKLVGGDLCKMLGFDLFATNPPWGHVTCDGSVANLEAMWAARNLKYYALSVKAALENDSRLAAAQNITVELGSGADVVLFDQDAWTLVNLPVDVVLGLPQRIQDACDLNSTTFSDALDPYLLQTVGFSAFMSKYTWGMNAPVIMGPATKHYSWPKNAALTGIGKQSFQNVPVDTDARMDVDSLDEMLGSCLTNRQPVVMVVVVLGSTEESAVDPLVKVLDLRERYRKQGLDFVIHIDGAWGGYFASIIREPHEGSLQCTQEPNVQTTPALDMSPYVTDQYKAIPGADSVTIDPHKAGYVPYAAGGLCYRNGAMRNLVAFLAPEVYHGTDVDSDMGVYGVEGSKPGAAAAGVYLSHRIIRPDKSGYGKILGQALFNSKRFYSAIVTMAQENDDFIVVPVQQIPAERDGGTTEQIKAQLEQIRTSIVERENNELIQDEAAMKLLKQLGSDQIIITYGLNFKNDGVLNTDSGLANQFMHDVFDQLSLNPAKKQMPDLIITTSEFDPADYGKDFVKTYVSRLGLECQTLETMNFLSSTTMCPWLTATAEGNFIPTLIRAFQAAVAKVLPK
jgi:glutamate/tyrosine decarboxylase-like PLP-dependent enzyme